MKTRPCFLLISVYPGVNGLLLPDRLAQAGADVLYAGSLEHLASMSGRLQACFEIPRAGAQINVEALRLAIEQYAPTRLVPLDEPAVLLVEQFAAAAHAGAPDWMRRLAALARDSLGAAPARRPIRKRCWEWGRAAGLALPAQCADPDLAQALAFGAQHGYPLYLKYENSAGGAGVHRFDDAQALCDWAARQALPVPQGAVLQQGLPGQLGMFAAVAEQGRMLAGVAAFQVQARSAAPIAPSSVVRVGPHAGMARAAETFIRAHGLSGMHGWDFMLDPDSGEARLIEWNPRPISVSHLGALCQAWVAALRGETVAAAPAAQGTVALFPYEWARDPDSAWLREAQSDLPWTDPQLVARVMQKTLRFV